eukprot:scaffold98170_cov70-Attheya_sp.AAC.4
MGQAFAFPLPVGWAAFQALHYYATTMTMTSATTTTTTCPDTSSTSFCRLNLGVALASLW